jgi:phosphosulfolactate phosphohydrolase-like enzyme
MTTVPQPPDIAALLALSDERDQWERRLLAAERAGWQAAGRAHADGYHAGYIDGLLRRKHLEHDAVEAAKLYARRWTLRGEQRTRETFGEPHPGDYQGRAQERGVA